MFKIGDFAQLTQATVKALRHYDRLGLLKPALVDDVNGYRSAGPVRAVYLELGNRTMTHGPEVTELQLPVVKRQP